MFGRRDYQHMNPADLIDSHRWWHSQLDAYQDLASQYGTSRSIRRGAARCRRQIRRIETAARRRRIRL